MSKRIFRVWVMYEETVEADDQFDAELMVQPAIERAIRSEEVEPEQEQEA